MNIAEQAFDVLHENLNVVRPEFAERDVILCPICLCEITKSEVLLNGVEHIIPRTVVENDAHQNQRLGSLNQRCGVTVLCRNQRPLKDTGRVHKDGCNGIKGSLYDRLFRKLFDDRIHEPQELTHRHGVAILIMGYLGAFQYFGYEYILQPELDEVRDQFDFPDSTKTTWLNHAKYHLPKCELQIVATNVGHPFVMGGRLTSDAPLEVYFRRCRVALPAGHWKSHIVPHNPLLLPQE